MADDTNPEELNRKLEELIASLSALTTAVSTGNAVVIQAQREATAAQQRSADAQIDAQRKATAAQRANTEAQRKNTEKVKAKQQREGERTSAKKYAEKNQSSSTLADALSKEMGKMSKTFTQKRIQSAATAAKDKVKAAGGDATAQRIAGQKAAAVTQLKYNGLMKEAVATLTQLGGNLKDLNSELYKGADGLSGFAPAASTAVKGLGKMAGMLVGGPWGIAIGIAAEALAAFGTAAAKQGDAQWKSYKALSEFGATTSDGIQGVFKLAQSFNISSTELGKLNKLIGESSYGLTMFKGTVYDGAKGMAEVSKGIETSGLRDKFIQLGYGVDSQNEALAGFVTLQARLGGIQKKTTADTVASMGEYMRETDALSKLTGATRKQQEAAQNKAMDDDAFRFKLDEMMANGQEKAATAALLMSKRLEAMNPEMASAFRAGYGSGGVVTKGAMGPNQLTSGKVAQLSGQFDQMDPEQFVKDLGKTVGDSIRTTGSGVARYGQFGETFGGMSAAKGLDFSQQASGQKTMSEAMAEQAKQMGKGFDTAGKAAAEGEAANINTMKQMQNLVQLGVTPAMVALSKFAKVADLATSALPGESGIGGKVMSVLGTLLTPFGLGFAEGGYTGDGDKYEPAGVVHKGEYVLNAETTRALGLANLPGFHQQGYATGGKVGSNPLGHDFAGSGKDMGIFTTGLQTADKSLVSFNKGLAAITSSPVLFGQGPDSLLGSDGVFNQLVEAIKKIVGISGQSGGPGATGGGVIDKITSWFATLFGPESGASGSGGGAGGTRSSAGGLPASHNEAGAMKEAMTAHDKEHGHDEAGHDHGAPGAAVSPEVAKQVAAGFKNPLENMVQTSGMIRNDGKTAHGGIDLGGKIGDKIMAPITGKITRVLEAGKGDGGFGNAVEIEDATTGMKHMLAHMDKSMAKVGDTVEAGTQIGTLGNTGQSTGAHLHHEIKDKAGNKIDPTQFYSGVTDPQGRPIAGAGAAFGTTAGGAATGNPQAAQRGQNMGATQMPGGVAPGFGSIAEKYETGGRGSGTVGWDSTGGTSYGKYQIASKVGSMDAYIKHLAETNPEAAAQLKAAGPSDTGGTSGKFVDTWKKLSDSGALGDTEASFMKKQAYDPAMAGIKNKGLQDMIGGDKGLQDMLFSTATQHGGAGASGIMNKVYKAGMTKEDLVNSVYAERGTRFGSSTPEVQKSVQNRFGREKNDVLGLMGLPPGAPGAPTTVAGAPTTVAGAPRSVTGNVPGVGVQPSTAGGVQTFDIRKIQQDAKMAAWQKAKDEGKSDEEAENLGASAGNNAGTTALANMNLGTPTAAMPGMPGAVPGVGLPGGDIGGMLAGLFGGGGAAAPAGGGGIGGLLAGLFGSGATAGPVLPGIGTAPGGADIAAGGAGGANIASSLDAISKQLADMAANQGGGSGGAQVPLLEQLVSGQREQTAAIGRLLQNQTA